MLLVSQWIIDSLPRLALVVLPERIWSTIEPKRPQDLQFPSDIDRRLLLHHHFSIRRMIDTLAFGSGCRPTMHWNPTFKQQKLYETWDKICQEYSGRLLSRRTDRMVALSGIVKYFIPLFPNEIYVAGIWREDIIPALLWFNSTPGNSSFNRCQRKTSVEDYMAPSWSWLSSDEPIVYANRSRQWGDCLLAEIQDVSILASTPDQLVTFERGCRLRIFGTLRRAIVRKSAAKQRIPPDYVSFDLLLEEKSVASTHLPPDQNGRFLLKPDAAYGLVNDAVSLLPLALYEEEDTERTVVSGIVLAPYTPESEDSFKRIGYFETENFRPPFYRLRTPGMLVGLDDDPWGYLQRYAEGCDSADAKNERFDNAASNLLLYLGPYLSTYFERLYERSITLF